MFFYLLVVFILVYFFRRWLWVRFSDHGIDKKLPQLISPFPAVSIPSIAIPPMPSLGHYGICVAWSNKKSMYKNALLKTVIQTPWLYGPPLVLSSSVAAFRQVLASNSPFGRIEESTGTKDLCHLGLNLVGAEGEDWRRHRRICSPAFNKSTYRSVWDSTAKVYEEMISKEGWDAVQRTGIVKANSITHKLALFIIAIVGFGMPMQWEDQKRDENGAMPLKEVIYEVSTHIYERSRIPKFFYYTGLPRLKRIDEAYTTFDSVMREKIGEREAELKTLRATPGVTEDEVAESAGDVFGRLVNARLGEGKLSMSDDEILSNCFAFMFAGHETTANTLAGTLGLLATNPEVQEDIFREIIKVLGGREPTFDDFDALEIVQACFHEGLRLYPAAIGVYRHALRDAALTIPRADDPIATETIHFKKGSSILVDLVGLSYDPDVFPDPEKFEPRRWLKNNSQKRERMDESDDPITGAANTMDGFLHFSTGPRMCIGHKFAKIEAVAFLTYLLRSWRVEPVLLEGESHVEWRGRVLKPHFVMTLMFDDIPVRFVRRSQ